MKRLPSDLELLNVIYSLYFDTYAAFNEEKPIRNAKIYVPLNISKIAAKLKTEDDIVFGRLYYHLERKYYYKQDDNSDVHFFADAIGITPREIHCINFPYMASILADLRNKHSTARNNFIAAAVSAIGAIASAYFAYQTIK